MIRTTRSIWSLALTGLMLTAASLSAQEKLPPGAKLTKVDGPRRSSSPGARVSRYFGVSKSTERDYAPGDGSLSSVPVVGYEVVLPGVPAEPIAFMDFSHSA